MAKGYVIASIDVADEAAYDAYRARTPGVIAQYGGRFIVRGGAVTPLEGDMGLKGRLVVLEFPSVEAASRFYHSPEYQQILPLRTRASQGALLIVEGCEPPTAG
jgi:uncharacterized protein (DUF1330 family)